MLFNTFVVKFMITVVILLCISTYALAQTQPRLINFQGKLTDQQGQVLDGTYTVIFSLYATATGGTVLWTERHENLSITNGLVNALLGSIQSLDEPQKVEFDGPRYLGITIDVDNNVNSPDPEMLPRQRIIPAIYAYNADTLDGKDSSFFTNPETDAGRPGVVEDLYEGDQPLSDKYIKQVDAGIFQQRVNGACSSGYYIRSINADGSVNCVKDIDTDTDTTLSKSTVQSWANEVDDGQGGSWVTLCHCTFKAPNGYYEVSFTYPNNCAAVAGTCDFSFNLWRKN